MNKDELDALEQLCIVLKRNHVKEFESKEYGVTLVFHDDKELENKIVQQDERMREESFREVAEKINEELSRKLTDEDLLFNPYKGLDALNNKG